mgnify:CR=1 FL=1
MLGHVLICVTANWSAALRMWQTTADVGDVNRPLTMTGSSVRIHHQVVTESEVMLDRRISSGISLYASVPSDPAHVSAAAGEVELAIVNLVLNARNAMQNRPPCSRSGMPASVSAVTSND